MSKDDDERLTNLIIYKMYATDSEIEQMAPAICVICVVAIVLLLVFL